MDPTSIKLLHREAHPPRMSWPTRAQSMLHPSRSLHSAPLPLNLSWLPQRAPCPQLTSKSVISIPRGRPTPRMGRPRAILHPEQQPDAQVHPELQLQGNCHQAQIIILLILLLGWSHADSAHPILTHNLSQLGPSHLGPSIEPVPFGPCIPAHPDCAHGC